VEIDEVDGELEFTPNASKESFWLIVIFFFYLVWDFLTKAVIAPDGDTSTFIERIGGSIFWQRAWASAACLAASFACYWSFHDVTSRSAVLLADGALLSLVLLFRAFKDVATAFAPKKPGEKNEDYSKRRAGRTKAISATIVFGLMTCVCTALASSR
jgi:hypothetical protein